MKTVEDDEIMVSQWNRTRVAQFVDWAIKLLIVATFTLLFKMWNGQNDILRKLDQNDVRISVLEKEVTVIRGQMVGWDVLTRIERTLGLLAATGKGNQAMSAVADVLRAEREAREIKTKLDLVGNERDRRP